MTGGYATGMRHAQGKVHSIGNTSYYRYLPVSVNVSMVSFSVV